MASIQNRSRWAVSTGKTETTFRLKSEALAHQASLVKEKSKVYQLEDTFEAQIKLKDREGNLIKRTRTFSSMKEAEAWATSEENRIKQYKTEHGSFNITYETMTFLQAMEKTCEEHYKGRPSYKENSYRVPQIAERIGKDVLLKDINQKVLINYRNGLKEDKYSPSSIRNYFAVISATLNHAQKEWLYPVENYTKKIKLEKPNNAIERNWEDPGERDRLMKSIENYADWIMPIVEMSLEMSFRLGELVKSTMKVPDDQFMGLRWEGVDFNKETVRIFAEKNDWKKPAGEMKGRIVPMTKRMKQILLHIHGSLEYKKTGPVFNTSKSAVQHALERACENAVPPIKKLTFHSFRKIATYDLSKRVRNPVLLGKLTGHRDVHTLSKRYFLPAIEDLRAMVNINDEPDIMKKGLIILKEHLGVDGVNSFLLRVNDEVKTKLEAEGKIQANEQK